MWNDVAGHAACGDYAKGKNTRGDVKTRKTKCEVDLQAPAQVLENHLTSVLNNLKIVSGKEDDDSEDEGDNPSVYLDELLAVADARYDLGQHEEAGCLYCRSYYAAMHGSNVIDDPEIFPIAHKLTLSWMKTGDEHRIKCAHGAIKLQDARASSAH